MAPLGLTHLASRTRLTAVVLRTLRHRTRATGLTQHVYRVPNHRHHSAVEQGEVSRRCRGVLASQGDQPDEYDREYEDSSHPNLQHHYATPTIGFLSGQTRDGVPGNPHANGPTSMRRGAVPFSYRVTDPTSCDPEVALAHGEGGPDQGFSGSARSIHGRLVCRSPAGELSRFRFRNAPLPNACQLCRTPRLVPHYGMRDRSVLSGETRGGVRGNPTDWRGCERGRQPGPGHRRTKRSISHYLRGPGPL